MLRNRTEKEEITIVNKVTYSVIGLIQYRQPYLVTYRKYSLHKQYESKDSLPVRIQTTSTLVHIIQKGALRFHIDNMLLIMRLIGYLICFIDYHYRVCMLNYHKLYFQEGRIVFHVN